MIECKETKVDFVGDGDTFIFKIPFPVSGFIPNVAVTLHQKGNPYRVVHEGEYKVTWSSPQLTLQYPLEGAILDEGDVLTVHKLWPVPKEDGDVDQP